MTVILFPQIQHSQPEKLANFAEKLQDGRYIELLFRYRARNYPNILTSEETYRWQTLCRKQLTEEVIKGNLTLNEYGQKLMQLSANNHLQPTQQEILNKLEVWGRELAQENGLSWPLV